MSSDLADINIGDTAAVQEALDRTGGWFLPLSLVRYAEMSNLDGDSSAILTRVGESRFAIKETVFSRFASLEVQYRLISEASWRSSIPDRYFFDDRIFDPIPVEQSSIEKVDTSYHAVWQLPADIDSGKCSRQVASPIRSTTTIRGPL